MTGAAAATNDDGFPRDLSQRMARGGLVPREHNGDSGGAPVDRGMYMHNVRGRLPAISARCRCSVRAVVAQCPLQIKKARAGVVYNVWNETRRHTQQTARVSRERIIYTVRR